MSSPSPPPLKRRRSSFFEPRKSLAIASATVLDHKQDPINDTHNNNPIDLNAYMQKLETEYAAWKSLYLSRKTRAQESKKVLQQQKFPDPVDESYLYKFLPEEYKNMLNDKPDIEKIKEYSIQFCKDWDYTLKINQKLINNEQKIIDHVKKDVDIAKMQLLEKSFVDFENK